MEKKEIRERIQDLEFTVEKQSTQLKELTRLAIAIRDDLQKSLLPKPSKGFFGKKDTDEVPVVPPISPELMDVFDKDKLNSDRINRNNKTDGDKNNIADKIKDVSYTYQDISKNSYQALKYRRYILDNVEDRSTCLCVEMCRPFTSTKHAG